MITPTVLQDNQGLGGDLGEDQVMEILIVETTPMTAVLLEITTHWADTMVAGEVPLALEDQVAQDHHQVVMMEMAMGAVMRTRHLASLVAGLLLI